MMASASAMVVDVFTSPSRAIAHVALSLDHNIVHSDANKTKRRIGKFNIFFRKGAGSAPKGAAPRLIHFPSMSSRREAARL